MRAAAGCWLALPVPVLPNGTSTNLGRLWGDCISPFSVRATARHLTVISEDDPIEFRAGFLLYILIGLGIEECAHRVEWRYHCWRTGRDDYDRPAWPDVSIVVGWPLFLMIIIAARRLEK